VQKAAQNQAQQSAASLCQPLHEKKKTLVPQGFVHDDSATYISLLLRQYSLADGKEGERPSKNTGNTVVFTSGGAEFGAPAIRGTIDPDLAAVILAWSSLHDTIKAGILAMVRTVGK